ncbi:hypothetical protein [Paraburkholderia caribensis]|uniref:hypothetical protein n=1 Tax=Paraburkholderia caribensis TaxID=75105 RepID=UPI00159225FA|nr:hypothetical protein [Paraburkholderia caribensis]
MGEGPLGAAGFLGFGFLGFWVFGFLGFWVFGFLGFWVFGFLGFWVLGFWVLAFALAFAVWVCGSGVAGRPFVSVRHASPFGVFGLCAGIRDSLARFRRRPCAGRHLLFFAAAKKSRQKKAAHTANS